MSTMQNEFREIRADIHEIRVNIREIQVNIREIPADSYESKSAVKGFRQDIAVLKWMTGPMPTSRAGIFAKLFIH